MSDQSLLSICIPTFERADVLRKTLSSLMETIDPSWEIIVSDDCSGDHTSEVLEEFRGRWKRFRTVILDKNIGAVPNIELVNRLATSKYIYTLSDDDQIVVRGINRALELLESNPSLTGVFGNYQEWIPADGSVAKINVIDEDKIYKKGSQLEILKKFPLLWDPVMRRELFQRHFQMDNHMFGQWPLVNKMLNHGDVGVITDVFYRHATRQSIPTMEDKLTEGVYQDMNRADYEIFIGEQFPGVIDNAIFVTQSILSGYKAAVRFALQKKEYLKARSFLLRSRAYGAIEEARIQEIERKYMAYFIAEKISRILTSSVSLDGVIMAEQPDLRVFSQTLRDYIGDENISIFPPSELADQDLMTKFVLVRNYEEFKQFGIDTGAVKFSGMALADLFETFRITDWTLEDMLPQ